MDTIQAYRVLEVEHSASFDQIKTAYRKLALELHPDKNTIKDDEKFKQVTEAYRLLKEQQKSGTFGRAANSKKRDFSENGTKAKRNFEDINPEWGAPSWNKPPEQDWEKFTRPFEEDPSWWKEYERKFWDSYNEAVNRRGSRGEFDKAEEPEIQPNLFVDVDHSLCIGCCSCEIIAPDVFLINKKRMNPKSSVINPKGAGVNTIMNAAETCPTKAIKVEDEDTREKLYPL